MSLPTNHCFQYITQAREVEAKTEGAKTKLVTLNAYKRDELEEVGNIELPPCYVRLPIVNN